jgi:hypothetical protein
METAVTNWLQKPYSPDMDVWHWILFVILIMVIASGWRHTLKILEAGV